MPVVTVVTLNWNSFEDTRECLRSLDRVYYRPLDVIVVDNASSDGSADLVHEWLSDNGMLARVSEYSSDSCELITIELFDPSRLPVHLILAPKNLGFCLGNNVGVAEAFGHGSDYALVLNNDTIAEPWMVDELVIAAEETGAGLVGGVICHEPNRDLIWWAGGIFDKNLETRRLLAGEPITALQNTQPYTTQWISGCMTLIPRSTYNSVGGFDEDFFIWGDEWDLSLRVARQGLPLVVAPSAKLFHRVGQSLGVLYPLSYYYGTRNRLMLKRKHLNPRRRRLTTAIFIVSRLPRYLQLLAQGRLDLVAAGASAIYDYFRGATGEWAHHDRYTRPTPSDLMSREGAEARHGVVGIANQDDGNLTD